MLKMRNHAAKKAKSDDNVAENQTFSIPRLELYQIMIEMMTYPNLAQRIHARTKVNQSLCVK